MRIERLDWRQDREKHIARHSVSREEVEEAVFDDRAGVLLRQGPAQRNPDEMIYGHLGHGGRTLSLHGAALHRWGRGDTANGAGHDRHGTEEIPEMSDTKANAKATKDQREAPDQARIEELAEHFDQTDVGDPEEFEEVEDVVIERRPELAQISMRIPPQDLAALRQQADRAGIGYTTLIRMIIRDHLNSSHGVKRRLSV